MLSLLEQSPLFLIGCFFAVGLMIGSFLNVLIHRLPRMMEFEWQCECAELFDQLTPPSDEGTFNLFVPRSQCPKCKHLIGAIENIPVISFVVLGGRCKHCKTKISIRYPLVELAGGITAAMAAWQFGFGIAAVGVAILSWALIALALIDFDTMLLPDSITLPFLWLGIGLNYFALYCSLEAAVAGAILGYLSLWSVYWLFKLVTGKEGMGYGDFKLLAMAGAWLGWQALPTIVILSAGVGAVIGIGMTIFGSHQRTTPMPFGPFLACAIWISLFWGDSLAALYLQSIVL